MNSGLQERTDGELVALSLLDKNAFRDIIERYEAPLKRYIVRLGCTAEPDADDALQEIFIKCYLNLNDYDNDLKFSSWVYRIAHNETISFIRKKRIRPVPFATEEDVDIFENIADGENLFENVARQHDDSHIRRAFGQVKEKYREVLLLRYFEDKSYDEISDILQIPEGTVAIYLNRGKKELKEIFTNERTKR